MNRRWVVFAIASFMLFVFVIGVQGSGGAPQKKEPTPAEKNKVSTPTSPLPKAQSPTSAGDVIPETELPSATSPLDGVEIQPAGETGANAPNYAVPWKSINGGGGNAESGTHKVSLSIGQAAIGYASGTNYNAGIGYWYGMAEGAGACDCGTPWGNLSADGVVNAVDVVIIVNYVYKMIDQRTLPPNCPRQPGDVNCVAPINAVDVVIYVNYVYRMMDQFCSDPCGP